MSKNYNDKSSITSCSEHRVVKTFLPFTLIRLPEHFLNPPLH
jgi:hypothetical protein